MTVPSARQTFTSILLVNVCVLVVHVVTGIMTARLLQPEGRGALAIIIFWPHFITGIGILSLQEAVVYRISQPKSHPGVVTITATLIGVLLAVVVTTVSYKLTPFLLGPERYEYVSIVQKYAILFIPFSIFNLVFTAVDHGQRRFGRYNVLKVLTPLVYLAGLVVLWLLQEVSVTRVALMNAASIIVAVAIRIFFLRQCFLEMPSFREGISLLKKALLFHVSVLIRFALNHMDRFVVIALFSNFVMGLYSVAYNISAAMLSVIAMSFQILMLPNLARMLTDKAQRGYLSTYLRYATFVIVSVAAAMLLVIPWGLPLAYGQEYRAAVVPTLLLLVGYIPLAFRHVIVDTVRGIGEVKPGIVAESIAFVFFAVTSWLAASVYGLSGIAFALLVSNSLSMLYLTYYMRRRFRLDVHDWWGGNTDTLRRVIGHLNSLYSDLTKNSLS